MATFVTTRGTRRAAATRTHHIQVISTLESYPSHIQPAAPTGSVVPAHPHVGCSRCPTRPPPGSRRAPPHHGPQPFIALRFTAGPAEPLLTSESNPNRIRVCGSCAQPMWPARPLRTRRSGRCTAYGPGAGGGRREAYCSVSLRLAPSRSALWRSLRRSQPDLASNRLVFRFAAAVSAAAAARLLLLQQQQQQHQ